MSIRNALIAGLVLGPLIAASATRNAPFNNVEMLPDHHALMQHFRSLGYKNRGGVDKSESDRDEVNGNSFPHFSSSFFVGGTTYPFTMVGNRPQSGRPASIKSVIIPLRMNFVYFGTKGDINRSFDPMRAVENMVHSPLYVPAQFPNGVGQFGDQMQRAAFWNQMDNERKWHIEMDPPEVVPTIDIEVTPAIGTLAQDAGGNIFGDVNIDFMDSQIKTILQLLGLGADTLPIFVTDQVTAQALGFHSAYKVEDEEGGTRLQTFVYTSWLDLKLVGPLLADVSTFNHELGEWLNDPFINNVTPDWYYPPPRDPAAVCSGNPSLEVGDPQGNGPTYADFPTAVVTLHGVNYHLQQLVLWQWFADQKPSSAYGGWYTFPIPTDLKIPAVYCP